jgi:hypothetical protein
LYLYVSLTFLMTVILCVCRAKISYKLLCPNSGRFTSYPFLQKKLAMSIIFLTYIHSISRDPLLEIVRLLFYFFNFSHTKFLQFYPSVSLSRNTPLCDCSVSVFSSDPVFILNLLWDSSHLLYAPFGFFLFFFCFFLVFSIFVHCWAHTSLSKLVCELYARFHVRYSVTESKSQERWR